MKRLLCLMVLLVVATGAQATVYFDIAPGTGYSEPLSQGDVIEISNVTQPGLAGEDTINSSWVLNYNSTELGRVLTSTSAFTFDSFGFISGSDSLNVDTYYMANNVNLHIWSHWSTNQYHSYSNNNLDVLATGPMTPSTSAWGLIILLLAVPAVIIWRR